jgi:hypothetical protein
MRWGLPSARRTSHDRTPREITAPAGQLLDDGGPEGSDDQLGRTRLPSGGAPVATAWSSATVRAIATTGVGGACGRVAFDSRAEANEPDEPEAGGAVRANVQAKAPAASCVALARPTG